MSEIKKNKLVEAPSVSFQDYLYANLFFWALLLFAGVVTFFTCGAVWDDVTQGALEFLFVIIGGGFTMVSVLDYFYEVRIGSMVKVPSKIK
jgi:uncharacterized membrane-anchored protein